MGRAFPGSVRGEKTPANRPVKRSSRSASRFDEARKVPVNVSHYLRAPFSYAAVWMRRL